MKIVNTYDYRNALGILKSTKKGIIDGVFSILNDKSNFLILGPRKGEQQDLSKQIQKIFVNASWKEEQPLFSVPDLRYDLLKENIPIEIEIGHQRLVYAVFFKFLSDYSNEKIPAGIMIVTENPKSFGHTWCNSRESTMKKIEAIKKALLVPILIIGIEP